jgi:hypothetical protein
MRVSQKNKLTYRWARKGPRAPELNGQENIWQFMRQNWLSNRIFKFRPAGMAPKPWSFQATSR